MDINVIEPLPWDTNFLGFGVARLTLHNLETPALQQQIAQAQAMGLRLLYLVTNPQDFTSNQAALNAGAQLTDRKVTFLMTVDALETSASVASNIKSVTYSTDQIERLALQSGEYSRFRLDNHFAVGTYERLYTQWLHNSLTRMLAREVLIYQPVLGSPALGLLTLGLKHGRADIGLLAVDHASRGQGIGHALVASAHQFTASWGITELQVATQLDNSQACNFYHNCGFTKHLVEHIYHLWISA